MLPRRVISSIAVLAALSIVALIAGSAATVVAQNRLGSDPVIGSWHVTVSFDDGRPNVLALYTFDRDRNFTMDGSWPGLFGSGHGSWKRDPGASFVSITFFRLLYSPSETNEATGALNATFNGTLKVQANLTVSDDGQSFTGTYLLTNLDPAGRVRSVTAGNLNGARMVVEALP